MVFYFKTVVSDFSFTVCAFCVLLKKACFRRVHIIWHHLYKILTMQKLKQSIAQKIHTEVVKLYIFRK